MPLLSQPFCRPEGWAPCQGPEARGHQSWGIAQASSFYWPLAPFGLHGPCLFPAHELLLGIGGQGKTGTHSKLDQPNKHVLGQGRKDRC